MPEIMQEINESENLSFTNFTAISELQKKISNVLANHPEQAENLLPALARLSQTKFNDIWPLVKKTFIAFSKQLPPEKIISFVDALPKNGQQLLLCDNVSEFVSIHPQTVKWIFAKFKKMSENASQNELPRCCKNLMNVICTAETGEARQMLNEALAMSEPAKTAFFSYLGKAGADRTDLRPQIKNFLEKYAPETSHTLSILYKNLKQLAVADTESADFYLRLTAKLIDNKNNDSTALKSAYETLAKIRENKENKAEVDKVLEYGIKLSANDEQSRKAAYRAMEKLEELYSSVSLGQRVKKNEEAPLGWKKSGYVDSEEVCVLFLGGDGTISPKDANGYLKSTEELLVQRGMGGLRNRISLYSIVYDSAMLKTGVTFSMPTTPEQCLCKNITGKLNPKVNTFLRIR